MGESASSGGGGRWNRGGVEGRLLRGARGGSVRLRWKDVVSFHHL